MPTVGGSSARPTGRVQLTPQDIKRSRRCDQGERSDLRGLREGRSVSYVLSTDRRIGESSVADPRTA